MSSDTDARSHFDRRCHSLEERIKRLEVQLEMLRDDHSYLSTRYSEHIIFHADEADAAKDRAVPTAGPTTTPGSYGPRPTTPEYDAERTRAVETMRDAREVKSATTAPFAPTSLQALVKQTKHERWCVTVVHPGGGYYCDCKKWNAGLSAEFGTQEPAPYQYGSVADLAARSGEQELADILTGAAPGGIVPGTLNEKGDKVNPLFLRENDPRLCPYSAGARLRIDCPLCQGAKRIVQPKL